jgi:hypothetical protein
MDNYSFANNSQLFSYIIIEIKKASESDAFLFYLCKLKIIYCFFTT